MFIKLVVVAVVIGVAMVKADCPDFTLKCPTGEPFGIETCWRWRAFSCQTCISIESELRSKCRKFSCGGSVDNWYGRNDGCSAKGVSGALTNVFRAACFIHDLCYATPGRTQQQCDFEFKMNMLTTCRIPGIGSLAYPVCAAVASIAYRVVSTYGNTFPDFAATCTEV